MRRRIKIVCMLVILTLCMPLMASVTLADSNSIIKDGIEYYFQTDKSVYNLGENVQMLYRVTNLRDEDVTFRVGVQPCSFQVSDGNTTIWWWPKLTNPAVYWSTLQPGKYFRFSQTWDMMNDNGTVTPEDDFLTNPGIYNVSGRLIGAADGTIPPERVSVAIEIIPELVIEAYVEIEPHTLNLKGKGKWLTCHIWLPEDYNVADIDPNSVLLEDEIQPEWLWFDEEEQVVMAKFSRSEVQELLIVGEVELTVTGQLINGTHFEGTDTIKVIDKGRGRK